MIRIKGNVPPLTFFSFNISHYVYSFHARSQAGAMGAIAPSAGPIAPSGASLCTLCTYRVSQNYPNMYFSTIISTYCAETTEDVDTKIF